MILADSPDISSSMVSVMTSLIFPIDYCGNFSPYFTIFDPMFNKIKEEKQKNYNLLIGVTNPLFLKVS